MQEEGFGLNICITWTINISIILIGMDKFVSHSDFPPLILLWPSLAAQNGQEISRPMLCISRHACRLSCSVRSDSETLWTVASQAPSVEFFRQEYWSGLPFSSSRGSSQSWGSNLCLLSPALQADSLPAQPPAVHIPKLH